MAMTSTSTSEFKSGNLFRNILQGISDWSVRAMNANGRVEEIDALNALSDEQLAAKGLTRDRIVHHVFRDKIFL